MTNFEKRSAITVTVAFLLSFLPMFAVSQQVNLIFAADMPLINDQQNGDFAELATLIKTRRAESTPTFFLFGGGSIGPSPMSTFDRGSHIIDILNSLEPDAMSVTKREFSYFEDELSQRSYEAAFPIVASNVFDHITGENLDGLTSSVIIEKGGIKLGVMSIINQEVVSEYLLERVQVLSPEKALISTAKQLRERGADIVLLTYSDPFEFIQSSLENKIIDVAIFSDPHFILTQFTQLAEHPNSITNIKLGYAIEISLVLDPSEQNSVKATSQEFMLKDFEAEPVIFKQVDGYSTRLDRLLNETIGELDTRLDTTRPTVRSRESAFANLLTDALRNYANADIAMLNGGVIRGEKRYSKGYSISRRDIAIELPFRSHVNIIEVTGSQILAGLENGFSEIQELRGRFPHVSGLVVEYDSSAAPGNRVRTVKYQGSPLQPDQVFKLVTSDYIASGGDGYDVFSEAKQVQLKSRVPPLISDILINEILSEGVVSPRVEGRLVDIADD